jgi:AAA domain
MSPPDGAAEIRRIIEDSPEIPPRLRPLSAAEFLRLDLPPRGMVLGPWLPEKGLAMIHSSRGVGKTHLALSVGYAVACGGSFLGFEAPMARRVLYLDGEMPASTMQRRLAMIISGFGVQPLEPAFLRLLSADVTDGGLPDLGTSEGQAEIDAAIGDAELIIVDNLSALLRCGKENEAESWLPVQSWALAHRRAGRSVLFIHHAGKGGLQRGTSRREDVLDTVIALRRPEDYRADQGARFEIHFEKARGFHGEDARSFEARYEERDGAALWTRTEIADGELTRVADALRDGMSIRETGTALGMHKSKIERLKKKAVDEGLLDD